MSEPNIYSAFVYEIYIYMYIYKIYVYNIYIYIYIYYIMHFQRMKIHPSLYM